MGIMKRIYTERVLEGKPVVRRLLPQYLQILCGGGEESCPEDEPDILDGLLW